MNKTICWTALLTILFIVLTNQAAVTVNKLDNISSRNLVYSGFLPISDSSSDQLFFTYYGKQNVQQQSDLKNYPLLIVVGSPGSSAQFINFAGMGPIKLKSDMTTVQNNESPSIFANVMFVDLLGNGFSFVADTASFPTKSEDYGVQLTYAINAFAQQSALGKSSVVVIVGQGTFVRSLSGLDDIDTLSGIIHISSWPELYAVSKYYGVAGVQLKLFGSSQRIAIESTLISCSNYVNNKKYNEAHNCYESILGFVESKTKNGNLFNVKLGSNLTDHLATIQYYLSQSSVVSLLKAPTNKMFDTQSNLAWGKTFTDLAINKTSILSQFMKDYLTIKHWFIGGSNDFISYKQSIRLWLENELSFVESAAFRTAKLDDIMIEGSSVGYGKQVKQVKYTELSDAGHYIINDQSKVFAYLLNNWLSTLSSPEQKNLVEEQSQVLIAQE